MASLYDLQTATINANGEIIPHESEIFQHIKAALKLEWEAITTLLKKCHSYGCDVERLRDRHGLASRRNIINVLKDMSSTCRECTVVVKTLTENHKKVILPYRKQEDTFKDQLKYPRVFVGPEPPFEEPDEDREACSGSYTQAGGR